MPKAITDDVVRQITKNLRDFGYKDLSEEHVKRQLVVIQGGDGELDIIGMFAKRMLEENGYI